MSEQRPSLARNVHYHLGADLVYAAIITKVWADGTINLTFFPQSGGTGFAAKVEYDPEGMTPRTWRWPPRI